MRRQRPPPPSSQQQQQQQPQQQVQPSPNRAARPSDVRRHGFGSPEGMELMDVPLPSLQGQQQSQQQQQPQQQQQTSLVSATDARTLRSLLDTMATPAPSSMAGEENVGAQSVPIPSSTAGEENVGLQSGIAQTGGENVDTPSKPRKRRLFLTPSPLRPKGRQQAQPTPPAPQPPPPVPPRPPQGPPPRMTQQQQQQQQAPQGPSSSRPATSSSFTTPRPDTSGRAHPTLQLATPTGTTSSGPPSSTSRPSSGQRASRAPARRPLQGGGMTPQQPMSTLSGMATTPRSSRHHQGGGRNRGFNPLSRLSDIFSPQSPSFAGASPILPTAANVSSSEAEEESDSDSNSSVKEPFSEQVERLDELLATPSQQLGDLAWTDFGTATMQEDDDLDAEMEDLEASRRLLALELSRVDYSMFGGRPDDDELRTSAATSTPGHQSPLSSSSLDKDPNKKKKAKKKKIPPAQGRGDGDDWSPLLTNEGGMTPQFSPPEPNAPITSPIGRFSPAGMFSPTLKATPSSGESSRSGMPSISGITRRHQYSSFQTPPREKDAKISPPEDEISPSSGYAVSPPPRAPSGSPVEDRSGYAVSSPPTATSGPTGEYEEEEGEEEEDSKPAALKSPPQSTEPDIPQPPHPSPFSFFGFGRSSDLSTPSDAGLDMAQDSIPSDHDDSLTRISREEEKTPEQLTVPSYLPPSYLHPVDVDATSGSSTSRTVEEGEYLAQTQIPSPRPSSSTLGSDELGVQSEVASSGRIEPARQGQGGNIFQSIALFAERLAGAEGGNPFAPTGEAAMGRQMPPELRSPEYLLQELDSILTPPDHRPRVEREQYLPAVTPDDRPPFPQGGPGWRQEILRYPNERILQSQGESSFIYSQSQNIPTDERGPAEPRQIDRQMEPSVLDATFAHSDSAARDTYHEPQPSDGPGDSTQSVSETPIVPSTFEIDSLQPETLRSGLILSTASGQQGEDKPATTTGPQDSKNQASKVGHEVRLTEAAAVAARDAAPYLAQTIQSHTNPLSERQLRSFASSRPSDELLPEIQINTEMEEEDSTGESQEMVVETSIDTIGDEKTLDEAAAISWDVLNPPESEDLRSAPAPSKSEDLGYSPDPSKSEDLGCASVSPKSEDFDYAFEPATMPLSYDTDETSGPDKEKINSANSNLSLWQNCKRSTKCRMIASLVCIIVVGIVIWGVIFATSRDDFTPSPSPAPFQSMMPTLSPTARPTAAPSTTPPILPPATPSNQPSSFASEAPTFAGEISFTIPYEVFVQNGAVEVIPESEYFPGLITSMDLLTGDVLLNIGNGTPRTGGLRRRLTAVVLPTEIVAVRNVVCPNQTPGQPDLCQELTAQITLLEAEDTWQRFKATTELAIQIGRLQFYLGLVDPNSPAEVIDARWTAPAPTPLATAPPSTSSIPSDLPSLSPSLLPSILQVPISPTASPTPPPSPFEIVQQSPRPSLLTSRFPSKIPIPVPSVSPTSPTVSPTPPPSPVGTEQFSQSPSSHPSLVPSSSLSNVTSVPPSSFPSNVPTTYDLFEFLVRNSFDGGMALEDPSSPQYMAYEWLLESESLEEYTPQRILQRYAMVTLYYSTNGEGWLDDYLWLTNTTECDWYTTARGQGSCNGKDELVYLELDKNDLRGPLPPELGLLSTSLVRMTIRGGPNKFLSKSIPSELGLLTKLEAFGVHGNDLTGTIPREIGSWMALNEFDISKNDFIGLLPTQVGNLENLTYLDISGNAISGFIPTELGRLRKCKKLYFDDNRFLSQIPTEFGDLKDIQFLRGGSNVLQSLPSQLGRLTTLKELSFRRSEIQGTIPTELGRLRRLELLELHGNLLTGDIPSELGDLSELRDNLDLSSNRLSGPLPSQLGNLVELAGLTLDSNRLTGPIPDEISRLTTLRSIRVNGNDLRGTIPTSVCTVFNETEPTFQADCNDFDDNCPCCTICCVGDRGQDCTCRYLGTPREFLCYQTKKLG